MKILGLISGTSVDGIDAALVEIVAASLPEVYSANQDLDLQVDLLMGETLPYPDHLRAEILAVCAGERRSLEQISYLDQAIAIEFAKAVQHIIDITKIQPHLIASHGQTVYHRPPQKSVLGYSIQLGRGEAIAAQTGITTISNFRAADIANHGEGAPLAPMLDWLLLRHKTETRCVQNIGGISNVTYLMANGRSDQVIGFDNAPGNVLMDMATQQLFGKSYDAEGALAVQGLANLALVQTWLDQEFFRLPPPKSTGRELFCPVYLQTRLTECDRLSLSAHDILATLTEFTARAIAQSYRDFLPQMPDRILLNGGGSRNTHLVQRLQSLLTPAIVTATDDLGINADFKEAIAFAVLGYLRQHNLPGNLPSVTGARKSVLLGEIHKHYDGRL